MVDPRCPQCSARVPAGADWCSLCYASLKAPEPARTPDRVAPAYASAAPSQAYDPLTAPMAALDELSQLAATASGGAPSAPAQRADAGAATGTHRKAVCWPCRSCEAQVPIELDACEVCGAGFLNAASEEVRLPLIGKASDLEGAKKAWVIIGGATGLIAAYFLVVAIIGLIF